MTPNAPDDRTATTLSEIRERWATRARDGFDSTDGSRLLKLADAVLKLADDWDKKAAELDAMAERADARGADPSRAILMSVRAQALSDCAQEFREAITTALTGKETP